MSRLHDVRVRVMADKLSTLARTFGSTGGRCAHNPASPPKPPAPPLPPLLDKLVRLICLRHRILLALPHPRERQLGLQTPEEPMQDDDLIALVDPDTAPWSFERPPDRHPLFDVDVDRCWEHTAQLSPANRLLYQECALVDGKVVGCHEAVVATPWYLTAEYLRKRLHCTPQDAVTLADCFAILDATPEMVETFLGWVNARGIEAGIAYFASLARTAAEAEAVDPEDALEHGDTEALEPVDAGLGLTPELALLLEEGVPSAALIAHRCSLSLAQAGEVREALILQLFSEAAQAVQPARHAVADDPWETHQEEVEFSDGVDVAPPPFVDWHLLDEDDHDTPWLERQPVRYQRLIGQVRRCPDLPTLKQLGKAVYEQHVLKGSQAAVFWTEYDLRKAALVAELSRPCRLSLVANRFLARIRTAANLPAIGRWLYRMQTARVPGGPSPAEWTVLWAAYHQATAHHTAQGQPRLRQCVSA